MIPVLQPTLIEQDSDLRGNEIVEMNTKCGEKEPDDRVFSHARNPSPENETWIQKNEKAKVVDGWRQTHYTAYAVRDATHVYKLSRGSPRSTAYQALTDRQQRIDFLKQHGVAKPR
ncbi:uncharacterized protein GGS22DRAFT_191452 [Annulohypoxylon maeteangense]|uniref:uncharacterized protein n=1 Tax=Annulohypoxylon maeteangense TaxID=1927788 RepID=UPI002008B865|nr:uncharacterized protein GGS22DRAFT_191452 [Annulohypoxylon maeteangense]KAI0882283.1 hypothetical protein GGS22DRAFT_191452 [Annulohypoxylon maeteangense]